MAKSSPVSPRDLALKEKKFQSIQEIEAAVNIMVRRLNDVYKYNRRDHDRLTQDVADVSEAGTLTYESHGADDTLTAAESGSVHSNDDVGGSVSIILTLPDSPAAGTYFTFVAMKGELELLKVEPGNTHKILGVITSPSDGKYIYAINNREHITLMARSDGDWLTLNKGGTWYMEA